MSETDLERVTQLADQLTSEEKLTLMRHLASGINKSCYEAQPSDLYGLWSGQVPDNFDVDAALKEIRGEWQKEWPEAFKK